MSTLNMPLGELPQAAVVGLVKANWAEFYMHLGSSPSAELSLGPQLSWLLTGIPDAFLNVVFRTDLPPGDDGEMVDAALRHFRSRRITRLSWWVDGAGSQLGRQLASRGLAFDESGTAMAAVLRDLPDETPSPTGLEIIRVDDRAALRAWVRLMRAGFGLPETSDARLLEVFLAVALDPPMHTYLALLDGQPVATSQLFVGAGVAGIYNVTCLPEARGRGIGKAVTRVAVLEGRSQGCDVGILQASGLGYPVYRRLGFGDYGRLATYQLRLDDPGGD